MADRYIAQKCAMHQRYRLDEICIHCDTRFCSRCFPQSTACTKNEAHEVVTMTMPQLANHMRTKMSKLNGDMSNRMEQCRTAEREVWRELSSYEDEVKEYCAEVDKTAEAMMQEIRHDVEIRKTRLRNHLQLSSDRARSFSEGVLNNISHLDEIYKRGEELVERSPDNEVITEFTRVTDQLNGDAFKVDVVQPFVMERAIFSKDKFNFRLGMRLIPPHSIDETPRGGTGVTTLKADDVLDQQEAVPSLTSIAAATNTAIPYKLTEAATQTMKPPPKSLQSVKTVDKPTDYYGVSWRDDGTILCAGIGALEVRMADLTLRKRILYQGSVFSAYSVGNQIITKLDDNKNFYTYIGTEGNITQTLVHKVSYEGNGKVSHMSATSTKIAVIDVDKIQLSVYTITGDHLFNIMLNGMKVPYGIRILPDDTVLVTDGFTGEVRKYPLQADAEPVWAIPGVEFATGLTMDESGYIYVIVKFETTRVKIKVLSPEGKMIKDLFPPGEGDIYYISVRNDMMVLAYGKRRIKLLRLKRR